MAVFKELQDLRKTLNEWKEKLSESENELHSLEEMLTNANEKNAIVKNDLNTMKPYRMLYNYSSFSDLLSCHNSQLTALPYSCQLNL